MRLNTTNLTLSANYKNYFWIIPSSNYVTINNLGQITSSTSGGLYSLTIVNGNQPNLTPTSIINPSKIYGYNIINFTLTVNPLFTVGSSYNLYIKQYNNSNIMVDKK